MLRYFQDSGIVKLSRGTVEPLDQKDWQHRLFSQNLLGVQVLCAVSAPVIK